MDTRTFFELVLPTAAYKALYVPTVGNIFYNDFNLMTNEARLYDGRGLQVYHANAGFLDPGKLEWIAHPKKPDKRIRSWDYEKRTTKCTVALKSLRLDIDAGPGKGYADADEAFEAFEAWRAHAQLPASLMVMSGNGWHVYWPLTTELAVGEWKQAAAKLDDAVKRGGLKADPEVTVDVARILRPPGMHNRKFGRAVEVVVENKGGPYDIGALFREQPRYSYGQSFVEDAILGGKEQQHEPSDPERVLVSCAQVRRLRDADGKLPEPEWYAVLGVLGHCGPAGRTMGHILSQPDPRYSETQCDAKLDHAIASAGPTTCARFNQLVPGVCLLCPHVDKIVSPIQLGREAETTAAAAPTTELPKMPWGFKWGRHGSVVSVSEDEDGNSIDIIISEHPVFIKAVNDTEQTSETMAVIRAWEPSTREFREFTIPIEGLGRDVGRAHLQRKGVVVLPQNARRFGDYMAASYIMRRQERVGVTFEQFGWKETMFISSSANLDCSDAMSRFGVELGSRGTVLAWRTAAEDLLRRGAPAHTFIALCGFAAPLYQFAEAAGGVWVHAFSRLAGCGKSTALDIASSAWGQRDGTQLSSDISEAAWFRAIGILNNLPVISDEPKRTDPERLKLRVMNFTQGQGAQRCTANGELRSLSLGWSTIMASAANVSLVQTLQMDGEEAQAARLFEIPMVKTAGLNEAIGGRLRRVLYDNSGAIGVKYAEAMVHERAHLAVLIPQLVARYTEKFADTSARFIVRLFATVTAAGWLLKKYDLFTVDTEAVMAWAISQAQANNDEIQADATAATDDIINQLVTDVVPYTLCVKPWDGGNNRHEVQILSEPRSGEVKARWDQLTQELIIDRRFVHEWLEQRHHSRREVYKKLRSEKVAKSGEGNATPRRMLMSGTARPSPHIRVWVIDMSHEALSGVISPTETNVILGNFAKN